MKQTPKPKHPKGESEFEGIAIIVFLIIVWLFFIKG
jgi:hypothetical protein